MKLYCGGKFYTFSDGARVRQAYTDELLEDETLGLSVRTVDHFTDEGRQQNLLIHGKAPVTAESCSLFKVRAEGEAKETGALVHAASPFILESRVAPTDKESKEEVEGLYRVSNKKRARLLGAHIERVGMKVAVHGAETGVEAGEEKHALEGVLDGLEGSKDIE